MIEFTGYISKILYRNDDFVIAILKTDKEEIKIVGSIYGIEKGEELAVKGTWEKHPKFGRQLILEQWERVIPQDEEQIHAFLCSPMVKGCGKKQANAIVNVFGKDALEVIINDGESCLLGIDGIGPKRAGKIVQSVVSTFEVQKVVASLLIYGITTNMALRVYKEYGSDSMSILKINPYKLMDMDLVGFLKADEIAKRMGLMPASGYRIEACLKYMLKKLCFKTGHTYIQDINLYKETEKALNHNSSESEKITMEELQNSINNLEEKYIVIEDGCVYPKFLYYQEDKLARKLTNLRGSRDGGAMPFSEKRLEQYQKKHGLILSEKQRESIRKLFEKQLLILTGGPGTGKTTVIRAMIDIYKQVYSNNEISLVAPTGRASRKLSEIAGCEASTIHRLLGYRKGQPPEYNAENKLTCKLLVIDEMSMVDLSLAYHLLEAIDNKTKILFVGDTDQLPSVSPGNVLGDMIDAGLPTVRLTKVFRQAEESQIISNAHRVNKGNSIIVNEDRDDFFFILQNSPERINQTIVKSAIRFTELGYSLSEIQILSPMKKGVVGTIALNHELREALNPANNSKKELQVSKRVFREGDKVIQIKNNYDKQVFNGDIGIISEISTHEEKDRKSFEIMKVDFAGKSIKYHRQDLKELELGYSITVHKSQGGEAAVVIIPVTTSHYTMLARNLIYTGITRAKEKMVFVGTNEAIQMAVGKNDTRKRNSRLAKRILFYDAERRRLSLNEVTP
ncbi:ATP-dependent RecD-like DNA helicase [Virgibacillus indicus]|uniref:ATP-dependent RecD2 DNA helicase n=1 Tax=Virgibacillus indicus TaxID=2024554 RepID=A0A265NAG7_9BACI|nr:ATP-dependent RecD-like DNA helicase [Virgibacillus indicus]OZU89022.1 ATP-dependent RecD-like DNA helicase [Virgibacillus indicus]